MTDAGSTPPLALITGASRGLGATLAGLLAAEGWNLVLTARRIDGLATMVTSLARYETTIRALAGDVTDPVHRGTLRRVVDEMGGLDLLVNNASELGTSPLPSLIDYPLEDLETVYRTNVVAPLGLIQALRFSLQRKRGLVVNISSDAAIAGHPGWGGYGASKAALDLVSLTLAHELKDHGIAVVSVDPGDLRTALHQAAFPGQDISDRPLPDVTLPFWAWLLHQPKDSVSGQRFRAQGERWEIPA